MSLTEIINSLGNKSKHIKYEQNISLPEDLTLKERMEMEPNYYKEKYHPDDYPTIVPQMRSFFFERNMDNTAFLYRVKHKDGNWHWL